MERSRLLLAVLAVVCGSCLSGPAVAADVTDVSDQLAAAHKVFDELGLTPASEDRIASAKHGVAEELRKTKPDALGISPCDQRGYIIDEQVTPQIKLVADIWQTSEAAEAYVLQLVPDARLEEVHDAPQGRLREGKSAIKEANIDGQACYVFTKPGGLIGKNVTIYLEYRLAVKVPRDPDPNHQRSAQQYLQGNLRTEGSLAYYELAGRIAVLSDKHGLTRRGGGVVKVVDANPQFTSDIPVPFTKAVTPDRIHQLTQSRELRRGAVTDGVSALLLMARVPSKGKASWQVINAPDDGLVVKLPVQDATRWRTTAAAAARDVPIVELTKQADGSKSHWAFGLYLPPIEFGTAYASTGRLSRTVQVSFHFEPGDAGVQPHTEQVAVELFRPPVVLVHGTYDNPAYCWQEGSPSLGGVSTFQMLSQAGYRFREDGQSAVFAVDYESDMDRQGRYHSSGLKNHEQMVDGISSSSFLNNANVVYDNPQGVQRAISVYRARRIAATQADLICHSLGGLVARLYARGFALSAGVPAAHYQDPAACQGCWYHRADNFRRGDIHRLITLCATHRGSDIPGILLVYRRVVNDPAFQATTTEKTMVSTLLSAVNASTGTGGAFRDQEPNSAELGQIGPTPVPAHAVATTCSWQDIQQFDGEYRGKLSKIYTGSPQRVMVEAFRRLGMPNTADRLDRLINDGADKDTILMAFWQGVFGNSPNDFTVRLESASGGLAGQYCTVIPGTLHGYASRYPEVQTVLRDLLTGSQNRFAPNGFPPAGGPVTNSD